MTARPSRGRTPRLPALPASMPTTQPHAEGARVAPHAARCVSCESWADAEANSSSINTNDTCGAAAWSLVRYDSALVEDLAAPDAEWFLPVESTG